MHRRIAFCRVVPAGGAPAAPPFSLLTPHFLLLTALCSLLYPAFQPPAHGFLHQLLPVPGQQHGRVAG